MIFPNDRNGPARYRSVTDLKVKSLPGSRSVSNLIALLFQFCVETQARYLKTAFETFCNIFAVDVIEAAGIAAPRHWADPVTGEPTPVGTGEELSANKLFDWYEKHGTAFGWLKVDAQAARLYALAGKIAVAVWRNPDPKHSGHIAIVYPDPSQDLYLAQAGAVNSNRIKLTAVWGKTVPAFWVHE